MPGNKLQLDSLLNQDIYLTWYSMLSDKVLNDLLKDDHPDPTINEVEFTTVESRMKRIANWVQIRLDRVERTICSIRSKLEGGNHW